MNIGVLSAAIAVSVFALNVFADVAQAENGRDESIASFRAECAAAGQTEAFCLGWATSMEKIRPRDGALPQVATNLFVRLAQGEHEAVQLFVVPKSGDLRNVKVSVSDDLVMKNARFAASNITACVLGYVNVTNKPPYKTGVNVATTNAPGYVRKAVPASLGWWPDPIMSHLDHADVRGDDVQGFWIDVHVPVGQASGTYCGTVKVSADGVDPVVLPLSVRVNDFVLPQTPMLPLAVSLGSVSPADGVKAFDAEIAACRNSPNSPANLWRRHKAEWCDFLADRYVTYGSIYTMGPDREMVKRLDERGFKGLVCLGHWTPPSSTTNETVVAKWRKDVLGKLRASYDWAKGEGILDRCFFYGCDEYHPHTFGRARWAAAEIHRELPGVPLLTTAADRSLGVDSPLAEVDAFVPTTEKYSMSQADKARARGRKVWWYFACDMHAPYANCFVEGQGIEMRSVMGAQAVKYRPEGFLYYWIGAANSPRTLGDEPFTDWTPRTWGHNYHGDGGWISVGPDGIPLSTIRFENFRDGLDDYAYAKILEERLRVRERGTGNGERDNWIRRAKAALAVPDTVVQSVRNYTDDPAVLYRWRDEMADLIETAP